LVLGLAALVACACGSEEGANSPFRFATHYLDRDYGGDGRPGWVRAADMDGDGDMDIVAGGGQALYVYENRGAARGWLRHGSLDGTEQIGANGAVLFDVDRDGDLDVVSAQYRSQLGWWENPSGALGSDPWIYHALGRGNDFFAHDILLADLDGDGRREEFVFVLYRAPEIRIAWFRPGSDPRQPWHRAVVEPGRVEGDLQHAGIAAGDLDADGDVDLAFSNGWYEASGGDASEWRWHAITQIRGISNTLIHDLNGDGRLDLVLSAGHDGRGVYWFEAPSDRLDRWRAHVVDPSIVHPECLQGADLDADGDLDLVTCDLDFDRWDREVDHLYALENLGRGERWKRHVAEPTGFASHLLQLVDIDGDGRLDAISEATGFGVVTYHERVDPSAPLREPLRSGALRSDLR